MFETILIAIFIIVCSCRNVASKSWSPAVDTGSAEQDMTKLCNHKKKIAAMAALQSSTASFPAVHNLKLSPSEQKLFGQNMDAVQLMSGVTGAAHRVTHLPSAQHSPKRGTQCRVNTPYFLALQPGCSQYLVT